MLRIGQGYDLHTLAEGRRLILGGVEIPSPKGAVAHSDGDCLTHAVIDAIVSPALQTNIGELFPDTDPRYKDADSIALLEIAKNLLKNTTIHNIDAVVVLDSPKIAPHLNAMRENLATALGIHTTQINVKGKTSEKTRPDEVECYVSALIEINAPESNP